jgi:triacylglycerol lipase
MSRNAYPIVLAHGIARIDFLRQSVVVMSGRDDDQLGDRLHYFKGIKSHLERHRFEVHHTSVSFAGGVDLRARQLSEQIQRLLAGNSSGKVHVIAHSMGGLDARHMIVDIPGMAEKVASLTTIGTPHLGTSFADAGCSAGGSAVISVLRPLFNLEGFKDLTTATCAQFNLRARDKEAGNPVVYRAYASAEAHDAVFLPLQHSWSIINEKEGENDGLVSVKSQHWTGQLRGSDGSVKQVDQLRFPFPADHLNEIGWWDMQEMDSLSPFAWLRMKKLVTAYENAVNDVYLQMAESVQE